MKVKVIRRWGTLQILFIRLTALDLLVNQQNKRDSNLPSSWIYSMCALCFKMQIMGNNIFQKIFTRD